MPAQSAGVSRPADPAGHADPEWHTSWIDHGDAPGPDLAPDAAEQADAAEAALLRKLRGRSLSEREARAVLGDHDLDRTTTDVVIARLIGHGYLDDAKLAEQLIHKAVDRKGQGRRAIAQALAQRGIAREVVDEAMGEMPDDDAERALDFARTKARQLDRLDFDTALRRLIGQLSRRGYPGSVAATAARTALTENGTGGGVRFR